MKTILGCICGLSYAGTLWGLDYFHVPYPVSAIVAMPLGAGVSTVFIVIFVRIGDAWFA